MLNGRHSLFYSFKCNLFCTCSNASLKSAFVFCISTFGLTLCQAKLALLCRVRGHLALRIRSTSVSIASVE